MPVNLVLHRRAVGVFNNRKFLNRRKHKKMFEPTFLHFFQVSLFMLLAALIYLKPKMHNVATISAFVLLFVTYIHLWTVNWLFSPLLILLSGDVEINPGPRHNSGNLFQSATGT